MLHELGRRIGRKGQFCCPLCNRGSVSPTAKSTRIQSEAIFFQGHFAVDYADHIAVSLTAYLSHNQHGNFWQHTSQSNVQLQNCSANRGCIADLTRPNPSPSSLSQLECSPPHVAIPNPNCKASYDIYLESPNNPLKCLHQSEDDVNSKTSQASFAPQYSQWAQPRVQPP